MWSSVDAGSVGTQFWEGMRATWTFFFASSVGWDRTLLLAGIAPVALAVSAVTVAVVLLMLGRLRFYRADRTYGEAVGNGLVDWVLRMAGFAAVMTAMLALFLVVVVRPSLAAGDVLGPEAPGGSPTLGAEALAVDVPTPDVPGEATGTE